jgi:hypothetical protein
MKWRVRPFVLAAGGFLAVVAAGATVPRWSIDTIDESRHDTEYVSLPHALHHKFLGAGRDVQVFWYDTFSRECRYLLALAAVVGLAVYLVAMWWSRPAMAADYKEGSGGAVPDGRVQRLDAPRP